jgi:acyl-coenzyme A synthetase/AMP-(fatty) acid ligase
MAFVCLKEDSTFRPKDCHAEFEKELKKYAAQVLPGFARPEWVEVVDELPKTSTGKVLKHVLRGRAAKL